MVRRQTVLFVDDEINVLSSLKRGLIDEDYRCLFANSGVRALELMETENVAVIVSDMKMPDMDGLKLLKEVEARYPKTIKIVLSGYAQLTQVIATINQVDIFKFITKPWRLEEEFKGVIQKALEYYRIQRENEEFREALGIKNQAYVNILRNIHETINTAKKSGEIIATCGKRILAYNKLNIFFMQDSQEDLLEIEQWIFDTFTKAAYEESADVNSELLASELEYHIDTIVKVINFDIKKQFNFTRKLQKHILYACILSYVTLFKLSLKTFGLYITCNMNAEGQPTISLVTPKIMIERTVEAKIDFFESVLSHMAQMMGCEFTVTVNQGNLIAVFTLPPEIEEKESEGDQTE